MRNHPPHFAEMEETQAPRGLHLSLVKLMMLVSKAVTVLYSGVGQGSGNTTGESFPNHSGSSEESE